jgi:Ni/Co efflux regulator RcnB
MTMKRLIIALAAGSMFAGPLAAQGQDTPAAAE